MKYYRFSLKIFIIAILLASPCFAQLEYISSLIDTAGKYIKAKANVLVADDRSWIPFTSSDKTKITKEVNGYLDQALSVLLDDSVIVTKNKIKNLYIKNRDLEDEIAQLNLQRLTAPSDKKFYQVWKDTGNDIEDKIRSLKGKISINKNTIEQEMSNIVHQLAKANINLSKQQVKNIFIATSGEDQLNSIVVLKNLYLISDVLKQSIAESNNITVNKKYYGVFLLATDAHKRQLEINLNNIESIYLPKLSKLQEDNQALMDQTRELAANNSQYRNNLIAQQQTQEVSYKFKELLINQSYIISDRLNALEEIIRYTENTYQTVDLASSLANSMDQSVTDLQALMEMPIIAPLAFENSLEDKFLEISQKLSAS
jgi:gas vesicle protein